MQTAIVYRVEVVPYFPSYHKDEVEKKFYIERVFVNNDMCPNEFAKRVTAWARQQERKLGGEYCVKLIEPTVI